MTLRESVVASILLPRLSPYRCRRPASVRRRESVQNALPLAVESGVEILLSSHPGWAAGFAANTLVYVSGIKVLLNGLTWAGVLHSWVLGGSIYAAFGLGGYTLVCLYFIVGSLVTKVKLEQKEAEGVAEKRSGRRSIGSVWGSGFAGTVCAVAALVTGNYSFYQIGFIASFGSKLSDTVSSEIGKAYGQTTFLVTTFEKCPKGTEGAISLEGTAAGLGAAALYALLAQRIGSDVWIVFVACMIANFAESFLGASFQGRVHWLTNDVVNVLQISFAALLAMTLHHSMLVS